MTKPAIHLNGTGAIALGTAYVNAINEIAEAMLTLEKTAPHGRDYYPQGNDAHRTAVQEHNDRILRIHSVLTELSELAEHCSNGMIDGV